MLLFDEKKPLKAIETLDTLKLIHMMYESSKKNNWVKYKDNNESKLGYKNWKLIIIKYTYQSILVCFYFL